MLKSIVGLAVALTVTVGAAGGAQQPAPAKLNVLFIAVDDLRPQMGCYGDPLARTPNIDRLAESGLVMERAYCQQAVCSPSRTSLLTGRRPDTTRVYDLETHFRNTIPDVVTLPQHFKQHGYHSQGMGKIYHGGLDDAASWSVPHWMPRKPAFGPEGQALMQKLRQEARAAGKDVSRVRGLPWEAPEVADTELPDGATADQAIATLREVKDRSFFLAVGFAKPHLPFVAPKKYWDLYSRDKLPRAGNPDPPKDAPAYSLTGWGELRAYHGMPKQGPVTEDQARSLVHGYYASMSYMDSQVGRVLDELGKLGLREKTVVILWGDHGWELGEHGEWCKHENYETSTHASLLISAPGQAARGKKSRALVEFVDLYPTLADLCGLPLPEGLEGTSFKPLLQNPDRPWKKAAFSQYPRNVAKMGRGMGHTMRTERYRFVEWSLPNSDFREYELYDHQTDPGENVNLAKQPEHAALVKQLTDQLHRGWKHARP